MSLECLICRHQFPDRLAHNARAFNNWLVYEWLKNYKGFNVGVYDFYNTLTGPDNHHRINKKIVEGEPLVNMINYLDVYNNRTHLLDSNRAYMVVSCPESKIYKHQVQLYVQSPKL